MKASTHLHSWPSCRTGLRLAIALVVVNATADSIAARRPAQSSAPQAPAWAARDLRAGIIGTDTSHVPAFTAMFQSHPEWRIRVVAAFKGGSPDLAISANR